MGQLIFDESTMINGNIFQFEDRLKSHVNKYVENGAILTTYFSQDENASTVDRGLRDIDQLFGSKSPLRYNQIKNYPIYGFGQTNPENSDELQVEDINVEGDAIILPSTVEPKQFDFFIINHLKMTAIFEITSVTLDSMKVDGYYKIHYRLHSTSQETIDSIIKQSVGTYYTDLNAIGSDINPIIREDDFIYRSKVEQMVDKMISIYHALFYNQRHNCFLFYDQSTGYRYFDMCGNEFMAKHGLANTRNSGNVIMLHTKINDIQLPLFYNNSVYSWIELGCPERMLQKFYYILNSIEGYPLSSFNQWNENDVYVMQPLCDKENGINFQDHSIFDGKQLDALMNKDKEPNGSEYEKLLWKYIHKIDSIDIHDVSLYTADALINGSKYSMETFIFTPITIYIIRKILRMN